MWPIQDYCDPQGMWFKRERGDKNKEKYDKKQTLAKEIFYCVNVEGNTGRELPRRMF